MASPHAVLDFRNAKDLGCFTIKFGLCLEQARRAAVMSKTRILDHGTNRRISQAHAAIEEMVFQLAQDAMALRVAVKIFEVRNFLFAKFSHRCGIAILAEPFTNSGFTCVTEGRIANVVCKACRLHNRPELVFVHILRQILFNQVIHGNREATAHA